MNPFIFILVLLLVAPFCQAKIHPVDKDLIENLQVLSSPQMNGRKTASEGAKKAAQYISKQYQKIGLTPLGKQYSHKFAYQRLFHIKRYGENIIGLLPAQDPNASTIVFTAHYDHLGGNRSRIYLGADDNASGVAAMLNIAKKLQSEQRQHHFLFVATDAEENGLYGAKALFKNNYIETDKIVLNINLDMLAVQPKRAHIYAFSSTKLKPLKSYIALEQQVKTLFISSNRRMNAKIKGDKINWKNASDHAIFAKNKIPFIYFGDGSHKNYHTPKDSFENIDIAFYQAVIDNIYQTTLNLDKQDLMALRIN